MTTPDFSRPAPTVTMKVSDCILWFDTEIDVLKAKYEQEDHDTLRLILKGTWLYLEVMKASLTEVAMQTLDKVDFE